jgi:hypothetical protein
MAKTSLREVLEAIGSTAPGITDERDAVALLDLHLGLVQACTDGDSLGSLIKVRDGAKKALETTFKVRTDSMLARSHADPLVNALAPLERLIERVETEDWPEKARFEKRWEKVRERFEKLKAETVKVTGSWPNDEMEAAAESFEVNAKVLLARKDALEFGLANTALDAVEKDLDAYDEGYAPINEKAKEEYLKLKVKTQKIVDKLGPAVAAQRFGSPPHDYFKGAVKLYTECVDGMAAGELQNDYANARNCARNLDKFVPQFLKAGFDELNKDWTARSVAAQKMIDGIGAGAFPGADAKPLTAALKLATEAMKRAEPDYECAAATDTFEPLEKALVSIRKAAIEGLLKAGTKTPKATRAKAIAIMKHDKEAMNALADQPGGPELLDAMVTDLGGKAKDADSKAFMRSAITARFGPELGDRDLTTKYLPKLYKILGMVPASHTLDNKMLKIINRKRTKLENSGDYSPGAGVINLKVPRTGLIDALESFGARVLPEKLIGKVVTGKGVSQFDVLALHEVAHSVDDKKKFMDGKAGNVTFGGWQSHTVEEVVALLGDALGFFKDFAALGQKPFLQAYLKAVLQKKKPQDESTVTAALTNGAKPDWKALAKHAAVSHAENIRMKNDSNGLWDRGDSAAAKYAIGGSVYQESYGGKWVSYALSARSTKVSDYQFRADGEWYAEAYAAFFVGKLKPGHPLHPLLTQDKQSGEAAKRAAR